MLLCVCVCVFFSLKLKRDEERVRQEKLARERLEAACNRRKNKITQEPDEPVTVDTDDTLSLQEAIAINMDRRHKQEQEIFMKVCNIVVHVNICSG